MFAIFSNTVARFPAQIRLMKQNIVSTPAEEIPSDVSVKSMLQVADRFRFTYPSSTEIRRIPYCILGSNLDSDSIITSSLATLSDDIICLFQGGFTNLLNLQQKYGLGTNATEAMVLTAAYRESHTRTAGQSHSGFRFKNLDELKETVQTFAGVHKWREAVKEEFHGDFWFVLFDSIKNTFYAASIKGDKSHVQVYWGLDSEDNVGFFSSNDLAKHVCPKFFGAIPKGCYVASFNGLRNLNSPCYSKMYIRFKFLK